MNTAIFNGNRRLRLWAPAMIVCTTLGFVATATAITLPRFEMQAVLDAPGGSQIVRGDYSQAVELATAVNSRRRDHALWRETNLCVAYTMKGQPAEAGTACDRAVDLAQSLDRTTTSESVRASRLARAHVNRAIAHWRSGELAAAEADFAVAQEMAPRERFVRRNAAALAARQYALAANLPQ